MHGGYAAPYRPKYHRGRPNRRGVPYRANNHIFTRPTWRSLLLSPKGISLILAIVVVGFGGFTVVSNIQRHNAEVAAQEKAAAEKKALARQRVKPSKLGQTVAAASTPRSEWKQGTMPHLYQSDPAWAEKPYGGGTARTNACGPTCMTMVYVYLTGKTDFDPGTMAAWADERNYAPTGAAEWAFMTEGAAQLGIVGENFWPARSAITERLNAGRPVIVSVREGDFTTAGHYIVLKSIDERGMVEVFDPASPVTSAKRWGIQELLLQITNAWAFSA